MSNAHAEMVEAVLSLWDMHFDTERMAHVLQIHQYEAERFLHEGLARRRRGREGQAAFVYDDWRRDS